MGIFSSHREAMEIVFLHNEALPSPVKRNFHSGWGSQKERLLIEELAYALKGILLMAISDAVTIRI